MSDLGSHPTQTADDQRTASVEILIVSYNTAALLAACLESIAAHLPPPQVATVSVSVLDNASSDFSVNLLRERFAWVRLIESAENVGFARANNRLAREATAEYVMLLNSDTRLTQDLITPLLAVMRSESRPSLVAPRLVYPNGQPQFSSERFPSLGYELARELNGTKVGALFQSHVDATLGRFRRGREIEGRLSHRAEFVWATCWLLRRDDVLQHGLFDERFITYDEDLDFCRRLRRRGDVATYVASTELVHVGGASSTGATKARMAREARERYYRRHATRLDAAAYRAIGSLPTLKALRKRLGRAPALRLRAVRTPVRGRGKRS